LKALIIDDSEINQLIIQKVLDNIGIKHEVAFSGQQAIDKFKENFFDLVFMDIQMPDMDGYQTTKELRTLEGEPKVPIIAVTANANLDDEAHAREVGMNEFLTKPVYPDQILEIVNRLLIPAVDLIKQQDEPPPSDIESFYTKISRDLPFLIKMADRFRISTSDLIEKIKATDTNNSLLELAQHVHSLKGIVAAFEVEKPFFVVVKLEEAVRINDFKRIPGLINDVESEIAQMNKNLQAFIMSQDERQV
jgi:CheY-like chemotaxis protein/predicted DNA-binding ribbon-helix-helix protein